MHTDRKTDTPQGFAKHWVLQASLLLKFYPGLLVYLGSNSVSASLYSWSNHLTSLYFSFLIYEKKVIISKLLPICDLIFKQDEDNFSSSALPVTVPYSRKAGKPEQLSFTPEPRGLIIQEQLINSQLYRCP